MVFFEVHYTPCNGHFGGTAAQFFIFGFFPIEFITDIHKVIRDFGRDNIFGLTFVGIGIINAVLFNDNRIKVVHCLVKDIKKVHILLQGASLVQKGVFGFAAASENAKTVIAELGVKIIVFAAFFDSEINIFELNRRIRVAALMKQRIGIIVRIINNQCLIADFLFVLKIRNAADGFLFGRFAHTVKQTESRIGSSVAHAREKFRTFFAAGGQCQSRQHES